ncbi:MAG: ion transporter [Cyclobacteriaceae bacterium]|nr:ion transporter [Cyclobacteriaceae bacterium]MCK5279537.1 ion transporter [Cyclobacteriaceae bacterium]MCK5371352.1 ion transporter [Cyclobacteriaceae bacterium]MCK5699647.1 ion transporter [Cyclobacteriaceae bacterium]
MTFFSESTRQKLHEIIFEADTFRGKFFDLLLICAILTSVLVVMMESVQSINLKYGNAFKTMEWIFTILFTLEYIARIIVLKKPIYYIKSFYGIIDLLSIIPTYLSLFFFGTQALIVLRIMRLLRIFRVLKLVRFLSEGNKLFYALKASLPKIIVFLVSVVCVMLIVGTLMYIIEGGENGFDSIPRSIYWAIVTMTTVGYGDIAPTTVVGQTLASFIMILGYGIIAVPTGIVASQIHHAKNKEISTQACPSCSREGHDVDAKYCKFCGAKM